MNSHTYTSTHTYNKPTCILTHIIIHTNTCVCYEFINARTHTHPHKIINIRFIYHLSIAIPLLCLYMPLAHLATYFEPLVIFWRWNNQPSMLENSAINHKTYSIHLHSMLEKTPLIIISFQIMLGTDTQFTKKATANDLATVFSANVKRSKTV